ncbi:hypothetical protein HID58_044624, partial [Brassica napus]
RKSDREFSPDLYGIVSDILSLVDDLEFVSFAWIPRDQNVQADIMAKHALAVANVLRHCAGINCLDVLNSSVSSDKSYLFTGSRDGTLKRWAF